MVTHGIMPVFHARCVVKPDKIEEVSPGGIIIPLVARNLNTMNLHEMTLVGVGCDAFKENLAYAPHVGDRVWVATDEGLKFTGKDGETYYMVNYKSIFGGVDQD